MIALLILSCFCSAFTVSPSQLCWGILALVQYVKGHEHSHHHHQLEGEQMKTVLRATAELMSVLSTISEIHLILPKGSMPFTEKS